MTVHSIDGQSWLTKLERIGEKSACDKQMVFNNIGHLLNGDMLKWQFQRLDGKKAVGIDGVTKEVYLLKLDENIQHLIERIRKGTYQPKPSKFTEIPKEDGSTRPLAISCLEDKLVQSAVSFILVLFLALFQQIFLSSTCSVRGVIYRFETELELMWNGGCYRQSF